MLFAGQIPLRGTILGQVTPLPSAVLACANCHTGRGDVAAAPDLRGGWLLQIRSRRNGPAGRYNVATFCAALRTGIDPVHVMLPVQMPRFTMTDRDCAALWQFLAQPL